MKMRRPHRIPLARQTIDVLKNLRAITGKATLRFRVPAFSACSFGT
jgi:integrase